MRREEVIEWLFKKAVYFAGRVVHSAPVWIKGHLSIQGTWGKRITEIDEDTTLGDHTFVRVNTKWLKIKLTLPPVSEDFSRIYDIQNIGINDADVIPDEPNDEPINGDVILIIGNQWDTATVASFYNSSTDKGWSII